MGTQLAKSADTRRGKTCMTTHAADTTVSSLSAACQQPVREPVSGNVSGATNQRPWNPHNFQGMVVHLGAL